MRVLLVSLCLVFGLALAVDISFMPMGLMPAARSHMAKAVVGTKIYLFGGRADAMSGSGTSTVYSYDALTNTWATLASTKTRYGSCAATDGESIWVFGGYDVNEATYLDPAYYGTYFISNNTWIYNRLLVFMFGCSAAYIPETKQVLIAYGQAGSFLFDPATNEFTDMTSNFPMSAADWAAGSVYYDNKLYLASPQFNVSSLRSVSSDAMTWNDLANNTNGSPWCDMIQVGGMLYTIGGSTYDEGSMSLDQINQYDVGNNKWTLLDQTLPTSLNGPAAAMLGPSLYVFGGLHNPDGVNLSLNDTFWIAPCVDPSVCQYGCNSTSAQCAGAPVNAPNAPNAPTTTSTPGSKKSTGFAFVLSYALIAMSIIVFA